MRLLHFCFPPLYGVENLGISRLLKQRKTIFVAGLFVKPINESNKRLTKCAGIHLMEFFQIPNQRRKAITEKKMKSGMS